MRSIKYVKIELYYVSVTVIVDDMNLLCFNLIITGINKSEYKQATQTIDFQKFTNWFKIIFSSFLRKKNDYKNAIDKKKLCIWNKLISQNHLFSNPASCHY